MTSNKTASYIGIFGIGFIYFNWLLSPILNPKLSLMNSYVSELNVPNQPYHLFFTLGNFFGAILMAMCFYIILKNNIILKKDKNIVFISKILFLISLVAILNALFTMDCAPSLSDICFKNQQSFNISMGQWVHMSAAVLMFGGVLFSTFYIAFKIMKSKNYINFYGNLILFVTQSILNILIITISFTGEGPIGLLQRTSLLLFQLWIVYILLNKEIGII
jgi:hypothetical protein